MIEKQDLISNLHGAFEKRERPHGERPVRGVSIEAQMVEQLLSQRSWIDLDSYTLSSYESRADLSALVAFLSPEGFRYYLPSLLLFVVDNQYKAGALVDAITAKLSSTSEEYGPQMFTPQQQLAVSLFLTYLKQRHPDDRSMGDEIDRALSVWTNA